MHKLPITKKNPVSVLPEKNRKIFTHVIPTLRKIQEKKYFEEIKLDSEKKKRINSLVKRTARMIGESNLNTLSEKSKKAVKNLIYESLETLEKEIGKENIDLERIRKIKLKAIALIFKIKKTHKSLLTKKEARDLITKEEILYFDFLKPKDKAQINNLIKYNLALINNQTHITFENYKSLKKKIFQEISHLPLDYVNTRLAKQEILNYPETKRRLKEMSESERNKLLKFLDKELTKLGSNVFSNNNFESVQNKFIRKLLFG